MHPFLYFYFGRKMGRKNMGSPTKLIPWVRLCLQYLCCHDVFGELYCGVYKNRYGAALGIYPRSFRSPLFRLFRLNVRRISREKVSFVNLWNKRFWSAGWYKRVKAINTIEIKSAKRISLGKIWAYLVNRVLKSCVFMTGVQKRHTLIANRRANPIENPSDFPTD